MTSLSKYKNALLMDAQIAHQTIVINAETNILPITNKIVLKSAKPVPLKDSQTVYSVKAV